VSEELLEEAEAQAAVPDSLSAISAGYIREWRDAENLPRGWALCDGSHNERLPENWILHSGSNNLPDMRDRFVIAADSQGNRRPALIFIMKLEEGKRA